MAGADPAGGRGGTRGWRRSLAALGIALAVASVPASRGGAQSEEPPRLEPPAVELTGRFDAAPSRRVYAAIADQADLAIDFGPHTRDPAISIDLTGLSPVAALERVALLAGHFHAPLDARTVAVAQDTPQNRKLYEPLGIRTFTLRHATPREVMTALRTLIDVRRAVPSDDTARVTVRETYPKLAAATRLVAMLDRPPSEIRLRVELLPATAAVRHELAEQGGELSGDRAQALRRELGAPLAGGVVGLVGTREAQWKLYRADGEPPGDGPPSAENRLVLLTARGRLTPDDDRIGLDLGLSVSSPGSDRMDSMRLVSSFGVAPGGTLAIPILFSGERPGVAAEHLVLLLTPEILARGDLDAESHETFLVGTEANVGVREP